MDRVLLKKWWWVGVLACGLVFLGYTWWMGADGRLHVYFLDIGQGDAILMVMPSGEQVLVDGGPGSTVVRKLGEVMPFYDKKIEVMVLSHPDSDHLSGLVAVLKRYEVEKVIFTGIAKRGALYEEFLSELQGVEEVVLADAGADFRFGEVKFDVLYPVEQVVGREFANVNDSSVAMMVEYEGRRMLLTGDLEEEGEAGLVAAYGEELKADIFKAGHHGSRTSSSMELLELVRPKLVVIQCGKDNSFGHPHAETLRSYFRVGVEEVRRTDLEGRVELVW